MKLEVLLSVMNLNKKDLEKMNITSKCTVINQCKCNKFEKYKNFNIYSYDEVGLSNSRNKGLEKVEENIVLLCDDDVIYNNNYEKVVIDEFEKSKEADIIIFNIESPKRINKKNKRLHFYNILTYSSQRIAFKKDKIGNIKFNNLFGSGAKYSNGEEALFLTECIKNKLKIYSSKEYIGKVIHNESKWFKGYNKKFFHDKGALFTAINIRLRHLLMIQYLLRHKEVLKNYNTIKTYKIMLQGSKEYINDIRNSKRI